MPYKGHSMKVYEAALPDPSYVSSQLTLTIFGANLLFWLSMLIYLRSRF